MTTEAFPLELRELTTGYGDVPVVRNASMRFRARLITTIIGSNGAGKSTVIKAAAGLLRAWKGSVLADGVDITAEPAWRRVGRGIAYVPQGRVVVPEMSVRDNLEIGAHILKGDRARIDAATGRVTELFPVLAQRLGQLAGTMSGGEQQMLAIGRALMTSPRVIILDEPSLGLSPKFVDIVFEKLRQLRDEGLTVVMVEQKASRALGVSDVGYVMHLGNVVYSGAAAELAANENVKRLFLGQVPEEVQLLTEDADG
jgi:ABC-type branched-subunit amino acid transport system ATPase component